MSEQNNELYKKPREPKPKAEDVAMNFLEEDSLKNLLNFLEFLKSIKLNPRCNAPNSWSVNHKGKTICYIKLAEGSWGIHHNRLFFEEYDKYMGDELKEFVWNNMGSPRCAPNCNGRSMTIMDKKFDGVCYCWPFRLHNADGAALKHLKKIIEVRKSIIADWF